MTPEQLLQPRYKVECAGLKDGDSPYPDSPFKVGQIIQMISKNQSFYAKIYYEPVWITDFIKDKYGNSTSYSEHLFNPYPHIFRKINWWEDRAVEDMPEYVKVINPNSLWEDTPKDCIRKVAGWYFNDSNRHACDMFPINVGKNQLYRLYPSTLQEYTEFINNKK